MTNYKIISIFDQIDKIFECIRCILFLFLNCSNLIISQQCITPESYNSKFIHFMLVL